jgi:hypothetical protein
VSIEALRSKKLLGASQDGSREFITLIASISAAPAWIPPSLIYQGESNDLQDTWLDDFDHSRHLAFFASSAKGWSSDAFGLQWMKVVFNPYTQEEAKRGRRLLIVDGHSSHFNMKFVDFADRHRILLVILPPHSTHRLQPLDIGLFSPLATYYTQEIDRLLFESQGLVRMTKRDFWRLFRPAWEKAFTKENISSAFAAAGIRPWNPDRVLAAIKRNITPPLPDTPSAPFKTPGSTRALRRTFKRLRKEGYVHDEAAVLLRAGERLATDNELLRHENKGLRNAIIHEKRKRKRGKGMKLVDGEKENQALFFSPGRVAQARQMQAESEEAEQQRKQAADDRKLQAAIAREEKAREASLKKIAAAEARAAAKEEKLRQKAEKQTERELQRKRKAEEATQRKLIAEEKRKQRLETKKSRTQPVNQKKRRREEEEVIKPQKRPRPEPKQPRNRREAPESTIERGSTAFELQNDNRTNTTDSMLDARMRAEDTRPISLPLRSGRTVHLPARFR